jgi:hypothetical protein
MANPSNRQKSTLANFLQASRTYFSLGNASAGPRSRGSRTLRTVVKSLLIAGSIGGPVGEIAYADPVEVRVTESRDERRGAYPATYATEVSRTSGNQGGPIEVQADETHKEFLERASQIFPESQVAAWTRIERAVFNHVMAQLIYRYGYTRISDQMLQQARNEMIGIVKRLTDAQLDFAQRAESPIRTSKT